MISWTIPTAGGLTGLSSFTTSFSQSSYSSATGSQNDIFYLSADSQSSSYQTGLSYTIHQQTASTTYHYLFQSYSTSNTGYQENYVTNGSGTDTTASTDIFANSFYSGSSTLISGITTSTAAAVAVETSTTSSVSYQFLTTTLSATETTVWTASKANSAVQFFATQVSEPCVVNTTQSSSSTFETVTTNGTTNPLGAAATVVRATNEIIYHFAPASNWTNFLVASDQAQSATQITIVPLPQTIEVPQVTVGTTVSGNNSSSWSFAESTYTSSFITSRTTTAAKTLAVLSVLPNETQTTSQYTITSTTGSLSARPWESSSGSHGNSGGSTTLATLKTTSHRTPGSTWDGFLSWHVLRTTTASTVFTKTIPVATCLVSVDSYGYTNDGADSVFQTGETMTFRGQHGQTQNFNTTVPLAPACSVNSINASNSTSVAKFGPKAARLDDISGQWFVFNGSKTVPFSTARDARAGLSTVLPTSIKFLDESDNSDGVTFSKNIVTYKQGTQTTTGSIALSGSSSTANISVGQPEVFGGSPGYLETFANAVGVAGLYKNRLDGQASVLLPGATTLSTSQAISKMEFVTAVSPPIGTGGSSQTTVYWTVPRNSSALPPAMPPNA